MKTGKGHGQARLQIADKSGIGGVRSADQLPGGVAMNRYRQERENSPLTEEDTLMAGGNAQKFTLLHDKSLIPGTCTPDAEMSVGEFTRKRNRDILDKNPFHADKLKIRGGLQNTPPKSKSSKAGSRRRVSTANNSGRNQNLGTYSNQITDLRSRIQAIDKIIDHRKIELAQDSHLMENHQIDHLQRETGAGIAWHVSDISDQIAIATQAIDRLKCKLPV